MPERRYVSAAHLAKPTGFSSRWLIAHAAAGQIPGACQPSGSRGAWRFDEVEFWRWWNSRTKKEQTWRPSSGVATNGGDASSGNGRITESPLRRRLKQLRKSD
jgi:hypothetical protein